MSVILSTHNICFGAQKNHLIVNVCSFEYPQQLFWFRNKNFFWGDALLTGWLLSNSLDPDQDWHNVDPGLDPNFWHSCSVP